MVITGCKNFKYLFYITDMVGNMKDNRNEICIDEEECHQFIAERIEMTWHDLYWVVEVIHNGVTIAEEEVKIITIKNGQSLTTTSDGLFIEFETIRFSTPLGKKYGVCICGDEMMIEMININ